MAKPSDKPVKKNGAPKARIIGPRGSDEILPVHELSILIVDDDPVDRMTVLRALRGTKLNPRITEATDIASALDLIRKNGFDVVLLDHILPDGKSIDLLRKLRDAGIRLPVVIVTGYGDEMLVADLLKIGAADYLPKDRISADSVARAISHAIRIHKAEEDKLKKDALLEAGAEAVILLNTQTERISVVSGALQILGKALGVDGLTAFEQSMHATSKLPAISHRFEWSRDSEDFKFNDPDLQNLTYPSLGLARWHAVISSGHPIGGAVHALPPEEQPFFTGRGVTSSLAVPVLVDGRCWGFVLIEDRHVERTWTEREKNMLTRIAKAIGSTLTHRRADEALRQSEERFRAIVEAQTDMISRVLPNGTITFVNEACCRFIGKKREELVGRVFTPFTHEEDRKAVMNNLASLSVKNPVIVSENRVVVPGGEIRWVQWTNQAFFDAQGRVIEIQATGHDITKRKKIEEELRESKEYLNKIINSIADPVFVKNRRYQFILVNDALCALIGKTREEILGKTDNDFFPREQVNVFRKHDELVLETGEENVNEECITDTSGRTSTIITKKTRYTDPLGNHILVGVIRDITERKKAEDELRRSDKRWNAHYRGYPVPTFTWQKDGEDFVLVDFNNAAIDMSRDGVSNLQGQTAKVVHKDFPEGVACLWRCYNRKSTFSEEMDYRMQTTGEIRRVNATLVFVPPDQVMVHSEDITERRRMEQALRESEANFRALAENAIDGIMIFSSENARCVYANHSAVAMSGYTAQELLNLSVADISSPDQAASMMERYKRRLQGEAVLSRYESTMIGKGGKKVPVDISVTITVWKGQPAALAMARDIRVQKQLEMERSRLASSLLDIQEKERQEISSMLHDHLGQLLTLTRLELGSVGSCDTGSKKSISNALERLDEAIGSVRRLAVSLRPPILDDLGIEVALETLTEEFADGSSIQTSFTHAGPKPALGNAEETCLYRVLQEALTNAAKHSGATQIDVQLRTTGDEVCLEIRDNGKGFDMDVQKNQKGIGFIGMRERLSRCGGTLDIISETEKGTTVLARIPKTGTPGTQEGSP